LRVDPVSAIGAGGAAVVAFGTMVWTVDRLAA
jgi:hypothetical protein